MSKLKLLDLFSGIGGFSLGLERTGGFETVAFCEIEEFPRRVLAKHWPQVPIYHDIRELNSAVLTLSGAGYGINAICGGFPCQDISCAGKGEGIDGARSGLWREYARLIGELRPSVVFVENVSALLGRGLERVLGDLATLGYDAEWHCIPASAIGAHHHRDRVWLVAYPSRERRGEAGQYCERSSKRSACRGEVLAYANTVRFPTESILQQGRPQSVRSIFDVSDRFNGNELPERWPSRASQCLEENPWGDGRHAPEPAIRGVADGFPDWAHQVAALGNAVVPQIPEFLGNAYLDWRSAA